MTQQDIKDNIRNFIIEEMMFGQGEVADTASFLEQGIIDSTGVLELVTHIEMTYQFSIENDELVPENLDSIDRVAAFVVRKTGPTGA